MDRIDWFHEARYGLFLHWGPYSVAARGEWVLNRECIPYPEYTEKYVRRFTAEHFDPAAWAALAREAGMGYVVLTTRHLDGFSLWDTKESDFNAVRLGPRRDLVRPFVEAVRAAGLKVGLYYCVADLHHPDYPGAYWRDWPSGWPSEEGRQRFQRYYQAQVRELLTQYGKIDLLWWDGPAPSPVNDNRFNEEVRRLQPEILINPTNGDPHDFERCEQEIVPAPPGKAWEACMTLNRNWGHHAGDANYRSPREVIELLIRCTGAGGNLLLNVGPRADGTIPEGEADILRRAGAWLGRNRAWLPRATRSPFSWNNSCHLTTRADRVYLHFHSSPPEPEFCLAEIANRVRAARFLESGRPIRFAQQGPRLFLRDLPIPFTDPVLTTVELEVEGEPQALRGDLA